MERKKPVCTSVRPVRQQYRLSGNSHLVARSFNQTASIPKYKATFRGSQQGNTSYIPYRSSKPQTQPDVLSPDQQHVRTRYQSVETENAAETIQPRQAVPWKRCIVAAAVICYSLYAGYINWVDPLLTNIHNQWHYGDARISYATMTINGQQRNLLGVGYKGQVEVIILPDSKDPKSQASLYIAPQQFNDGKNRVVLLHPGYVNQSDQYPDIAVEVEGTQGVWPVLYGKADGSFVWNTPPAEKG